MLRTTWPRLPCGPGPVHKRARARRRHGLAGKPGEPRLGFEFLEGRAVPKPEDLPEPAKDKRRGGNGGGGNGNGGGGNGNGGNGGGRPQRGPGGAPPPKGSVPKVPLVKVP